MSNFKNYTLREAECFEESTTVVGDIDRWAELYLETGQHLIDWQDRMAVMMRRWYNADMGIADGEADRMLSSVPLPIPPPERMARYQRYLADSSAETTQIHIPAPGPWAVGDLEPMQDIINEAYHQLLRDSDCWE